MWKKYDFNIIYVWIQSNMICTFMHFNDIYDFYTILLDHLLIIWSLQG